MPIPLAHVVVTLALAYLALGLLFGVLFVLRFVERCDPGAAGTGPGFRLLILPGVAALWPLLLARVLRGCTPPPVERSPHRDAPSSAEPR